MVISLKILFLETLYIIITKDTLWAIIVAMPIPFTPRAGTNRKPKINIGFKTIFRKNDKIKTFL